MKSLLEMYDDQTGMWDAEAAAAKVVLSRVECLRKGLLDSMGIYYRDRGPDWDSYSHEDLFSYYSDARQVVAALDDLNQKKINAKAQLSEECGSEAEESAARILGEVAGRA